MLPRLVPEILILYAFCDVGVVEVVVGGIGDSRSRIVKIVDDKDADNCDCSMFSCSVFQVNVCYNTICDKQPWFRDRK